MRAKSYFYTCICGLLLILFVSGAVVYYIDPYMHYHMPLTETYFYILNSGNERNTNYGIARQFEYNAIVTGTSMAENFKTSELDEIFGVHSIKLPYAGGSYKEINDSLDFAFRHNDHIKIVIRGLDLTYFFWDKDSMRNDLGEFPVHLYNENPLDDVKYLFNKNVFLKVCYSKIKGRAQGVIPGITSFDRYAYWQPGKSFGSKTVLENMEPFSVPNDVTQLTEEDRERIHDNITQNVTDLCNRYPETVFYYFFTPYSAAWWGEVWSRGELERQIDAERYIIELILECDNIKLFSFNTFARITCDLNNYKDVTHYGEWVNSSMLQYMKEDVGRLTDENYLEYIESLHELYSSFDYNSLFDQEDVEDPPPDLQ